MKNQNTFMIGMLVVPLALLGLGVVFASSVTTPNTFSAGTVAVAEQVNANFAAHAAAINDNDARITTNTTGVASATDANIIKQVYTGSLSNTTVEFTAIPASEISAAHNYVEISCTCRTAGSYDAEVKLDMQIKEAGGSYATILGDLRLWAIGNGGATNYYRHVTKTVTYTAPITSGMRTNGLQCQAISAHSGISAGLTNYQTVIKLVR